MSPCVRAVALAAAMGWAAGCVGPRLVTDMTSTGERVTFAWAQRGGGQGLVECEVRDGTVSNCREVALDFRGDE